MDVTVALSGERRGGARVSTAPSVAVSAGVSVAVGVGNSAREGEAPVMSAAAAATRAVRRDSRGEGEVGGGGWAVQVGGRVDWKEGRCDGWAKWKAARGVMIEKLSRHQANNNAPGFADEECKVGGSDDAINLQTVRMQSNK